MELLFLFLFLQDKGISHIRTREKKGVNAHYSYGEGMENEGIYVNIPGPAPYISPDIERRQTSHHGKKGK